VDKVSCLKSPRTSDPILPFILFFFLLRVYLLFDSYFPARFLPCFYLPTFIVAFSSTSSLIPDPIMDSITRHMTATLQPACANRLHVHPLDIRKPFPPSLLPSFSYTPLLSCFLLCYVFSVVAPFSDPTELCWVILAEFLGHSAVAV